MSRPIFLALGFLCVAIATFAAGGAFYLLTDDGSTSGTDRRSAETGRIASIEPTSVRKPSLGESSAAKTAAPALLGPVAEAPETTYDFGVMDPFQDGRHTFVVYNRGDEPLVLEKGETSCKCTFSDLPENTIPPGGTGRVELEWKTHKVRDAFANTAEVVTNDPRHRVLTFRVEGKVRHQVRTTPEAVMFGSIDPGATASRSFLVFSQTWDDLKLENLTSTREGVELSTRPASEDELRDHDAKSGLHVDLTLPGDLPSGDFLDRVTFEATPGDGSGAGQHYEVSFAGKVTRCLCLYGLEFTLRGGLDLGTHVQGERKDWTGVLRVRGEPKSIEVLSIETVPADLQVEIEPMSKDGEASPGLYKFRIVLPENAERGTYAWQNRGQIKITTDHPVDPVLEFPIAITILGFDAK